MVVHYWRVVRQNSGWHEQEKWPTIWIGYYLILSLGSKRSLYGLLSIRAESVLRYNMFRSEKPWIHHFDNEGHTMSVLFDVILDGLMRRYSQRVPDVGRVVTNMISRGIIGQASDIENDHIAFRTMGVEQLGIQSLEKIFVHCGYQRRDAYHFAGKKLDAYWYSPPEPIYPRIFISELRVGDLSTEAQKIIRTYTDQVVGDPVLKLDLNDGLLVDQFLHQSLWSTPSWQHYQRLLDESEYAAWVIYNRYYLNHFTISVHNLPAPWNTINRFNEFVESIGVQLNDAGGKIKTSPDGLLIQSSSVAQLIDAEFAEPDGTTTHHTISGSYVEFAERRVLPEFSTLPAGELARKHRRDGFEASNADKIFESTFRSQTGM